jgi:hypothetical protein
MPRILAVTGVGLAGGVSLALLVVLSRRSRHLARDARGAHIRTAYGSLLAERASSWLEALLGGATGGIVARAMTAKTTVERSLPALMAAISFSAVAGLAASVLYRAIVRRSPPLVTQSLPIPRSLL